MATRPSRKKIRKDIPAANANVNASYNNTIVSFTHPNGDLICWASAGEKFKGGKKSTPYAAQDAASRASAKAKEFGVKHIDLYVKGPGPGRDAAAKAIIASGFKAGQIKDVTPIPHNGCKPPKKRRT